MDSAQATAAQGVLAMQAQRLERNTNTEENNTMKAFFEGIEASKEEWEAVGATVHGDRVQFTDHSGRRYQVFLQACFAVGRADGSSVIAWMLTEMTRQNEEAARIDTQRHEAAAVKSLHDVIDRLADRIGQLQEALENIPKR